jgi:phosphoribosylglycinamide formyltransferase 1
MLTRPLPGRVHQGPLRVAVLCSQRAPGLMHLLNSSPDRGVAFDIVCCVTSERTFAEEARVERRGIPTLPHPIADFYEARGTSIYSDVAGRQEYDRATLAIIEPFFPDIVLLDGYRYLVTAVLLGRFPNRILNLHFSDLTLRTIRGAPRFPGLRAVRDALAAGCRETRATVHLVNDVPDGGSPIVRSWPFPVSPLVEELRTMSADEAFKAYAFAHQEWMLRTVSGPLVSAALRLIAAGAIDLDAVTPNDAQAEPPWVLDREGALTTAALEFA